MGQATPIVNRPLILFPDPSSEPVGRLCFAPGAILLDALAIYLWLRLLAGKSR